MKIKSLLCFAALLLCSTFSALAAVDLGDATSGTPYDRYMAPVRQVFDSMHSEGASMESVQALMRQGRGFRYAHVEPFLPALPQQTAARRCGDCKDKALWLIDQMHDGSARFVIGKLKRGAAVSHAWVMWQHEGRWWILDCTMNSAPIAADRAGDNEYVPLYSFSKTAAYRHTGKAGLVSAVAAKSKAQAGI
jgi:hypothetical protein